MSDLAVLAGIVGSDGHLAKDEAQIIVLNKNKEFVESIVVPLLTKFANKIPTTRFVKSGYGTGKYFVRVWSQELYKILNTNYKIPVGRKSNIIQPPENLSLEDKIDFLRGWIAGDGSVTNERKRTKIEIWSKSKEILEWFREVLHEVGLESRMFLDRKKNEFILRIGKQNSVKLFYQRISIPHPEKQNKLNSLAFQQFSTS